MNEPVLCLGVFGHVDHGKTEFVKTITNINTSRFVEENEKNISLNIGFAVYSFSEKNLIFLDSPGHKNLINCPLVIAPHLDYAFFIISPDLFFPMEQTRDHLKIVSTYLPQERIIFVQNKCDLYSFEENKAFYHKILDFLKDRFQFTIPKIIPFSNKKMDNMDLIFDEIKKFKKKEKNFVAPIFHVFSSYDVNYPRTNLLSLAGGVVSGIYTGEQKIKKNDVLYIYPNISFKDKNVVKTTVNTIHLYNKKERKELERQMPGTLELSLDPYFTKQNEFVGRFLLVLNQQELESIFYFSQIQCPALFEKEEDCLLFYLHEFYPAKIKKKTIILPQKVFFFPNCKIFLFLKKKKTWSLIDSIDLTRENIIG